MTTTVTLRAQEEPVPQDKIPKVVMDALLSKFPNAKIDQCSREKDGDNVVYDIEFKEKERKCEADITERGSYINFERAIEAKDLPKAVLDVIAKRYPNLTLAEIMEEIAVKGKKEKLAAYEIVLLTGDGKREEVKISPEGKILEESGTDSR